MIEKVSNGFIQEFLFNLQGQQANTFRLRGIKNLSGQEVTASCPLTNGSHDVRADGRGRQAQLRLGKAEFRFRRADRDVAGGNQPGTARERRAVHARDGGDRHAVERGEHVGKRLRVGKVLLVAVARHALHPVQVRPGAERRPVARKDENPDVLVFFDFKKCFFQGSDQCIVKSIPHLRPVERDAGHAAFFVDQ